MMTSLDGITKKSHKNDGLDHQSEVERACKRLSQKDFSFFPAAKTKALLQSVKADALDDFEQFQSSWARLSLDQYMADGGNYRKRRHATLSALPSSRNFHIQAHQPHYQSLNYNDLNGGIARHYEPIEGEIMQGSTMGAFITLGCELFGRLSPYSSWHIEAHQFRIESQDNSSGKPTPEGVHQDGVNYVIMAMVKRSNMVNGSTQIYNREKVKIDEFTLQEPFDMAIVNDERTHHSVTPIVQLDLLHPAARDVLVVTFKKKS
jgi:hypothetical protein